MSTRDETIKQAMQQIIDGASAVLAALPGDDEPEAPEVAEVPDMPDYHAQDLERIEAQADAEVKVIEAQAAAAVAVIEAQAGDAADQLDDAADDAIDDAPGDDAEVIDEPDDLADVDDNIDAATDVLDDLPQLDETGGDASDAITLPLLEAPEPLEADTPPKPMHWYLRPLFGGR